MNQRSWLAGLLLPCAVSFATTLQAQGADTTQPRILSLEASADPGMTSIVIHTNSESVSYISYSRDDSHYVVDLYGLDVGDVPTRLDVDTDEVAAVTLEQEGLEDSPRSARFVVRRRAPGLTRVRLDGTSLRIEALRGGGNSGGGVKSTAPGAKVARTGGLLMPARVLQEVRPEWSGASLNVKVLADGILNYRTFELENPPRLVLDLVGVTNQVRDKRFVVDGAPVEQVRIAQFQYEPELITRVVFDLAGQPAFRVDEAGSELGIVFATDLAQLAASPKPAVVSFVETAPGGPPGGPALEAAGVDVQPEIFGAPQESEGTLISLDLKDADIKDVLRYFSEISGLNIILDPAVSGTITVRLIDVPWNKALDIILRAHGYGKTLDGNVLRIADVAKLSAEEAQEADFQRAREESRPLVTITRQISYAKAIDIKPLVESTALSSKGSIQIDNRTSTLVITEVDIEEYRERILNLIDTLDVPTPQVEIEARVVETSKSFTRSFGLQWGFNQKYDTTTGSTTDFTFPNSGEIRGDLLEGGFENLLPNRGWAVNLPSAGANAAIGFHLANITDAFQLDVVLAGLEDEGRVRLLSAPRVTTQSNESATINSGLQIPVQTVANNTVTTTFVDADLSLAVRPQVTADNTVILEVTVSQGSPDLGVAIGVGGTPPINRRSANTKLMVPDGGTAVIGGVFQLNESTSQSRLPILHNLPVLGWLFKNKTDRRSNNELLIFITPKIKRFP